MNYAQKTISAVGWTSVLRGVFRVVNFIKIAILARLLTPDQFGIFGIMTITLAFLEILTETGINPFLIAEKNIKPYLNTAWIISIFRGLLISIILFASSHTISIFFNATGALLLLQVASLVPLIRGLINPACVNFVRTLNFKSEFFYRSSILAIESIFAIVLTFITKSPIGLVWSMVISSIFEVLISFIVVSPRPKFSFNYNLFREILSHGKYITGFGILEYIFTNLDNIIVGRLLGSFSLGLYQNAYKLSTIPLGEINDIIYKSAFPIYSHMQSNNRSNKSLIIKLVIGSTTIMFVLAVLLFIFAGPVVLVLLGSNWISIVPTVKTLAFLGVVRGISYSFNSVFMAKKKDRKSVV